MPRLVEGNTYYFANEVAKQVGISKPTLLRWIEQQLVNDAAKRDRNGWRLFSEPEIDQIRKFAK